MRWRAVGDAFVPESGDGVNDPVSLYLDTRRPIGERRRALGTVQEEAVAGQLVSYYTTSPMIDHLRETTQGHAQVRVSTVLPLLCELDSVHVLQTHILHTPCHRIEASRKRNNVELMEGTIG